MPPQKTVLVTGSSNGIGETIAKEFAKLDYKLVITGRSVPDIQRVAAECENLSPSKHKPLQIVADFAIEDDLRRLALQTKNHFDGKLNILVNNAGLAKVVPTDQFDACYEAYKQTMQVNLNSVVYLTLRLAGCLRAGAQESGHASSVVNISSVAGQRVVQCSFAYGVSKGALNSLTEYLALELAPSIRVNAVSAGPIVTKIVERSGLSLEQFVDGAINTTALKRHGKTGEVAQAVLSLSIPERASYVTGTNFLVDGGFLIKPAVIWK